MKSPCDLVRILHPSLHGPRFKRTSTVRHVPLSLEITASFRILFAAQDANRLWPFGSLPAPDYYIASCTQECHLARPPQPACLSYRPRGRACPAPFLSPPTNKRWPRRTPCT